MSFTSRSEWAKGRPRGGDSTCTVVSPTRAHCPATGSTSGTPRSAAAARSCPSYGLSVSTWRNHTAPTSTPDSTAGSPAAWSACGWLSTTRSSAPMPRRRSHVATSSSSGPPSTRIRAPPPSTRTASPCPTSIAVTVSTVGADRATGTSRALATATTATATRATRDPRRASSHATPATTRTSRAGRTSDTTGRAGRRVAARTTCSGTSAQAMTTPPAPALTTPTTAPSITTVEATAAAGTATRFAGTEASGTAPKASRRTGATATCAPIVTPASWASPRGHRCSRRATSGATTSTPAVAVAESSRPIDPARAGSIATRTSTAAASAWVDWVATPRARATSTAPAMTPARSTDGSARVSSTNHANPTTSSTRWPRAPSRRATARASSPPRTIATLEPDTATRWVRPTPRMASSAPGESRRVSPVTSPTARPARSPSRPRRAAARTRPRTCSVLASSVPGGARTCTVPVGSTRATTCCRRNHSPNPSSSNGRAVARNATVVPSATGRPSSCSSTRSWVRAPSNEASRTTVHHRPCAASRGSVATIPTTSPAPPVRAIRSTGPPTSAARCRPASPPKATRTPSTAMPGRRRPRTTVPTPTTARTTPASRADDVAACSQPTRDPAMAAPHHVTTGVGRWAGTRTPTRPPGRPGPGTSSPRSRTRRGAGPPR